MVACFKVHRATLSILLFLLVCLAVIIRESNGAPPWFQASSIIMNESADCNTDDELLDLCQRCAKLTKSKLAYPACCSTDLEARRWCNDFIYFGQYH